MKTVKRKILLTPGPATTTDSVKFAQVVPDECPREKEFGDLMKSICLDLSDIAGGRDICDVTLFGGSGTAAIEAMISSCVGEGMLLIVNNGAYGERMLAIAKKHGIRHCEFHSSPVRKIEVEHVVATAIDAGATHLAMVHHETSSGMLNDIYEVASGLAGHGCIMLIDAISSFAALPVDVALLGSCHVVSTANKNLQGMPGISFVISSKTALAALQRVESKSFYLDLKEQGEYFKKTGQARFTMPVQSMHALRQAIDETLEEGVPARLQRYMRCWSILKDGIDKLGFKCLLHDSLQARLLLSIIEPDWDWHSFDRMHDFMKHAGYVIYPGKVVGTDTFRICTIGAINEEDIRGFVEVLGCYVSTRGGMQ